MEKIKIITFVINITAVDGQLILNVLDYNDSTYPINGFEAFV